MKRQEFLDTEEVLALRAQRAALLESAQETLAYWDSTGFGDCDEGCDCIVDQMRAAVAKAKP